MKDVVGAIEALFDGVEVRTPNPVVEMGADIYRQLRIELFSSYYVPHTPDLTSGFVVEEVVLSRFVVRVRFNSRLGGEEMRAMDCNGNPLFRNGLERASAMAGKAFAYGGGQ